MTEGIPYCNMFSKYRVIVYTWKFLSWNVDAKHFFKNPEKKIMFEETLN